MAVSSHRPFILVRVLVVVVVVVVVDELTHELTHITQENITR